MSKPSEIWLLRIAPETFASDFLLTGRMFMNSLRYFREHEGDAMRDDPSEGLVSSYHKSAISISFEHEGRSVPLGPIGGPVRFPDAHAEHVKVFCMYAITIPDPIDNPIITPGALKFGEKAVLIRDGSEFLRRVRQTFTERHMKFGYGLVEYVDPDSHAGDMGPFRKYRTRAYQSEFRIAARSSDKGPLEDVLLGPLTDIAEIFDTPTLASRCRFIEPPASGFQKLPENDSVS